MRQPFEGRIPFPGRGIRHLALVGMGAMLTVAVLPAAPAFAAPVTCGSHITSNVRLDADLTCGSDVALYLDGQDIVLDLDGHTISGSGVGIHSTFGRDATVRNGMIRGFGTGVVLDRAVAIRIENIGFISNGVGASLSRTVDSAIVGNRFAGSEASGVSVYLSARNQISSNAVHGNGVGITLDYASDNTVSGNRVAHSRADGIALLPSALDNVVTDNIASHNGDDGIDVDAAATVSRNTANHNVDLGIEAVPGVIDDGGNTARGNGNPAQCTEVSCA